MNPHSAVNLQALTPLFVATYQGQSTSQINHAYSMLLSTAKQKPVEFIKNCQQILQTKSSDIHLCQSVSNFIKFITKVLVDNKIISSTGTKDFINKIEYIFDNDKIPLDFKYNVALSYIKAALYFQISLQKIVGRISFLYNTKQIQKAALLSRAYLACESRIDAKSQNFYYNRIFKLQVNNLSQQILSFRALLSQGNGLKFEQAQAQMKNIYQLLNNIHCALVFISFEKFESSIFKCLETKEIINIVNSLELFKLNDKIRILLRELIQKIMDSLFRMRRMHKLPDLMQAISQIIHSEWKEFQQNLQNKNSLIYKGIKSAEDFEIECQISAIKLITSGLNCRVIMILDNSVDILNVLIHPLFQVRTQIFQKSNNDVKETFHLFEDTCFSMKSECIQVEFNRFVKALLTNYEIISSKVYLTLDQVLFENKNFQDILACNQDNVILLLSLLAFETAYFMTNTTLIGKVTIFLKKYSKSLFNHQNLELYFQSLLILFNYLDDIFFEELQTNIFQEITQNFIQNKIHNQESLSNQLIAQFEKKILKAFYQFGFTDKQVSKQVPLNLIQYLLLIQYLTKTFDSDLISIYIEVIKNYKIEDKITLEIFDKMFQPILSITSSQLINQEESHEKIRIFVKFLETFFDLDIYKHLFESTLSRIFPIFEILLQSADLFMEEFYNIIKNAVKHLEYVPENYYSWMNNLFTSQRLRSQESFFSLVIVLKYALPSKESKSLKYGAFVNFTALSLIETIYEQVYNDDQGDQSLDKTKKYVQIEDSKDFFAKEQKNEFSKRQFLCLLTLHQLIYYHCGYLTQKTLEKVIALAATQMKIPEQNRRTQLSINQKYPNFSFVQGKYQLIFVLLFRRRLKDVNEILTRFNIEQNAYKAVYMRDYNYLTDYDTPILIKEQAQILKTLIFEDKLQMACANTSFLTIFYKFCILYEIKGKQKHKSEYFDLDNSDSDEEEFQVVTEFKTNFKYAAKLVKEFPLPKEWSQVNGLNQIKEFIHMLKRNEKSREWLDLLAQNCMTKPQITLMRDLMKDLENVNGTYRHIVKVKKNL